mgnify:CR=1 FL=1
MATKTISIMEDAYEILLRNKARNESFSQVIRRTMKRKRDIMEFAGTLDMDDEEADEIKKKIELMGENSTRELLKRVKK